MPYALTWEPEGVLRRFFGPVTVGERRASLDAICGDRRFDDLRYAITDYLAAESFESNPVATLEIAALHIGPLMTNPRIVIATVATQPDIVASTQQHIELRLTREPYRIFPTVEDARAWVRAQTGRPCAG